MKVERVVPPSQLHSQSTSCCCSQQQNNLKQTDTQVSLSVTTCVVTDTCVDIACSVAVSGCLHSPVMPASAVLLAVQLQLPLHPDRSIFCCNNRVGCVSAIIPSHLLWSKALTTLLCA